MARSLLCARSGMTFQTIWLDEAGLETASE